MSRSANCDLALAICKNLLGAPGLTTRSNDDSRGSWPFLALLRGARTLLGAPGGLLALLLGARTLLEHLALLLGARTLLGAPLLKFPHLTHGEKLPFPIPMRLALLWAFRPLLACARALA